MESITYGVTLVGGMAGTCYLQKIVTGLSSLLSSTWGRAARAPWICK